MRITTTLEEWPGSPVISPVDQSYRRQPATQYNDSPARLTPRQAVFYRNLIRIAEEIGSNEIPVDFEDSNGTRLKLDRGCIKIAEHAEFIEKLENRSAGVVDVITLRWQVA